MRAVVRDLRGSRDSGAGVLMDGVILHATTATMSQVRAECIRRVEEKRRQVGLANGKSRS